MKRVEKETKMIEATVEVTTIVCDMCDKDVELEGDLDAYDQEISAYVGEFLPGEIDTVGTEYSVDLCKDCMKVVLFEIFPKYGINVNDE